MSAPSHCLSEHSAAFAHYEQAASRLAPKLGPDHPTLAALQGSAAEALLELGQYGAAVARAEHAIALFERCQSQPPLLARARFVLARALVGAEREVDRALQEAHRARAGVTDDPPLCAQIDHFLACYTPPVGETAA